MNSYLTSVRVVELERLRNDRAQLLRIGAIGDDQVFAVDEAIGSRRIGRTGQRHRKRPLATSFSCIRSSPVIGMTRLVRLFATILLKIEGGDAVRPGRALQHLGVAQRAHGVVVAGAPMILHRQAGKLVVLRVAFVVLRAIDQVHDVVDVVIGDEPAGA